MTLLSSLGIQKLTHWLFPIYLHSERVGSSAFHFFQWKRTFLWYDPDRFCCVRISTQIQIQHYNTNPNSHMHPSVHTTLGLLHFISFQNPQYYFFSSLPKQMKRHVLSSMGFRVRTKGRGNTEHMFSQWGLVGTGNREQGTIQSRAKRDAL